MAQRVLKALRDSTQRLIAENPSTIVVQRVQYVDDGAGGRIAQAPAPQAAFTGRLLPIINQQQTDNIVNDQGVELQEGYSLLCPHTATIEASSLVKDSFTVQGRTYEVLRVVTRLYNGQPFKKTATLRVVS